MITYRSFTTSEVLIIKLIERWNLPPTEAEAADFATFKKEKLEKVRLRVTQTFKYWLENFFQFDWKHNEPLRKQFEFFIDYIMRATKGENLANMLRRTYDKAVRSFFFSG